MLSQRRGPVGELAASCANLETPVPLIDIVNECLEYLGAASANTAGVGWTPPPQISSRATRCGSETSFRKTPTQTVYSLKPDSAALPEYSTPAAPVAQPDAYGNLKKDFSSCDLPYSQALDLSRSYLRYLGAAAASKNCARSANASRNSRWTRSMRRQISRPISFAFRSVSKRRSNTLALRRKSTPTFSKARRRNPVERRKEREPSPDSRNSGPSQTASPRRRRTGPAKFRCCPNSCDEPA